MGAIKSPSGLHLKHVPSNAILFFFPYIYKIKQSFSYRKFTFCLPNQNSSTAWGSRAHPWPRPPPRQSAAMAPPPPLARSYGNSSLATSSSVFCLHPHTSQRCCRVCALSSPIRDTQQDGECAPHGLFCSLRRPG